VRRVISTPLLFLVHADSITGSRGGKRALWAPSDLTGVDEIALSLTARGLTTGEISAHCAEVYGASVSKETISKITDKVVEEMTAWCNGPSTAVYPVIFIDAIMVKVRDAQVRNKPIYVVIGVSVTRERDILGR